MYSRSMIPLGGCVHPNFSSGCSFSRSQWVGRSVIPQVGPGYRYLTGPGPGRGLGRGRIQGAEGTSMSVSRSVGIFHR